MINTMHPQSYTRKSALGWMYYHYSDNTRAPLPFMGRYFLEQLALQREAVVKSASLGCGAQKDQAAKHVSEQAPTPALYK